MQTREVTRSSKTRHLCLVMLKDSPTPFLMTKKNNFFIYHVLAVVVAVAAVVIVAIAVVLVPFLVLYPKWTTKDVSLDLPVLLETTLRLDPFIQARDSLGCVEHSLVNKISLDAFGSLSHFYALFIFQLRNIDRFLLISSF